MMMNWQQQAAYAQRAMRDATPVAFDVLLVPRNSDGVLARQMEPNAGIVPREAAVLVLLFPHEGELSLPLTVRCASLPQHGGEVSLPGGASDPEDESYVATALRETHEELGIPPDNIEIWGMLSSLYIPASNFRITPVVGFIAMLPPLYPCSSEIADVFCVSVATLFNPATVVVEEWLLNGVQVHVPFYALHGNKVWGATALVLSELVARMRRAGCVLA